MSGRPTELRYIRFFEELAKKDVKTVGGKNASLGEMAGALRPFGIEVPGGFALTAEAYRLFLSANKLEKTIFEFLKIQKVKAGAKIRKLLLHVPLPLVLQQELRAAYHLLSRRYGKENLKVAVRSSATAEDLPEASFAGQHESFLNVQGADELLSYAKRCMVSLFTDRAIAYREEKGFDHRRVFLSVGVQKMVRADLASAGVMFTLETESGFPDIVTINAAFGLGENVVGGKVNPDEYQVYKPFLNDQSKQPIIEKNLGSKEKKLIYSSRQRTRNISTSSRERSSFVLSDQEILKLASWGAAIEKHYARPMDIEWAKDGDEQKFYIVQARPETVFAKKGELLFSNYRLEEKGRLLFKGLAIGSKIASGPAQVIRSVREIKKFQAGNILVTTTTTPDWVPVMKKASGIITDLGGRTSHAAIVSRELGIPAIVGSRIATKKIKNRQLVTISCAKGEEGLVYDGLLKYKVKTEKRVNALPKTSFKTKIMLNIASPSAALRYYHLPVSGIGLARMEFIISNTIRIHPMAILQTEKVKSPKIRSEIEKLTCSYPSKSAYFVELLAMGIAKIAASQYPQEVILRLSDFKTNEYAALLGGSFFEPKEENPMLGFRGASRYYHPLYQPGFELECRAIHKAREEMGFKNLSVMVPFCRTLEEAKRVLQLLCQNGLKRARGKLKVYVMAEIPSNVILAEAFASLFDGFSIGSNDLTQLILGVDRDSALLSSLFKEDNPAVKWAILQLIEKAHLKGVKVGLCGQAPSDNPAFARFLIKAGIDSISLNPDAVTSFFKGNKFE
ncbi:MAG: phosphoenolpyruvate synthase [Parachlamydiales bacterium]|jgi:pyruvate,water dikinase